MRPDDNGASLAGIGCAMGSGLEASIAATAANHAATAPEGPGLGIELDWAQVERLSA